MSDNKFSRIYQVKWADLDPLGHVRHSVYDDYAVDARLHLLDSHGYPQARFIELGFAPVILRQEARFYREITIGESITITTSLAGMSPDGARWKMRHDVLKSGGEKAATLTVEGTWLSIETREPIAPPPDLFAINDQLPRTKNFEALRSFVRKK